MSIVKAFIGGLVGAVIASVVLMVLRDGNVPGYEWFPLVTGLVTGLGVRLLAGSTGRSLVTGIIAGLIAMVAILAGEDLLRLAKNSNTDFGRITEEDLKAPVDMPKVEPTADAVDGSLEGSDSVESATDPEVAAARERARSAEADVRSRINSENDIKGPMPPAKRPVTLKDYLPYIFSGIGVLLAYRLGRGSCPPSVDSHEEHVREEEAVSTADADE